MYTIEVLSTAFEHGGAIPATFTCDGDDISPLLHWSEGPVGTVSYALLMEDPDAHRGIWVHWVAWNIPANGIHEGAPPELVMEDGTRQGQSSWGRLGYGGPCPPPGEHRYFFKVYALDTLLDLDATSNKKALLHAMIGHVLAEGELIGLYSRVGPSTDSRVRASGDSATG
jgi:Raf kinase inhibitor-like YbhB/YbcL family protein